MEGNGGWFFAANWFMFMAANVSWVAGVAQPQLPAHGVIWGGSALHEIRRLGPREALITSATLPLCSHSSAARPYLVIPRCH